MIDKIVLWLIKHLILFWDRHEDKLAFCFSRNDVTDYNILAARYYDAYYTYGTNTTYYREEKGE